jgi:hypothetical protein
VRNLVSNGASNAALETFVTGTILPCHQWRLRNGDMGTVVGGCRILGPAGPGPTAGGSDAPWVQYSPLITKYEPRMVPASFDF